MQKGIVISNKSNLYLVKSNNKIFKCLARGKLKNNKISPIAGDIVEFDVVNIEKEEGIIENIEERKNTFKRPKICNITQMVLVISLKNPSPDFLMLDKQIAFAEYNNIKTVIVFNKIDLEDNEKIEKIKKIYTDIGYKVILTDAKERIGIEALKNELKGNISAFSGNSGVGKSTLINDLFNKNITEEGEISSKNKRGKNTTTQVSLYEICENTYIADTPGFSVFDIEEIESKTLENYFIEFKNHIKNCAFVGCTHIKEESCGIKEAVKNNLISNERYNSYKTIYMELKDKEKNKW